jgi:hypothetical protein
MNFLFCKIAKLSRAERSLIAKLKNSPLLRDQSLIIRAPKKQETIKHFDMSYIAGFVENMKIMLTDSDQPEKDLEHVHDFLTCLCVYTSPDIDGKLIVIWDGPSFAVKSGDIFK